jgi:hypothetical protein
MFSHLDRGGWAPVSASNGATPAPGSPLGRDLAKGDRHSSGITGQHNHLTSSLCAPSPGFCVQSEQVHRLDSTGIASYEHALSSEHCLVAGPPVLGSPTPFTLPLPDSLGHAGAAKATVPLGTADTFGSDLPAWVKALETSEFGPPLQDCARSLHFPHPSVHAPLPAPQSRTWVAATHSSHDTKASH